MGFASRSRIQDGNINLYKHTDIYIYIVRAQEREREREREYRPRASTVAEVGLLGTHGEKIFRAEIECRVGLRELERRNER